MEFIDCDDPADLKGNKSRDDSGLGGCYKVYYYYICLITTFFFKLIIII